MTVLVDQMRVHFELVFLARLTEVAKSALIDHSGYLHHGLSLSPCIMSSERILSRCRRHHLLRGLQSPLWWDESDIEGPYAYPHCST